MESYRTVLVDVPNGRAVFRHSSLQRSGCHANVQFVTRALDAVDDARRGAGYSSPDLVCLSCFRMGEIGTFSGKVTLCASATVKISNISNLNL